MQQINNTTGKNIMLFDTKQEIKIVGNYNDNFRQLMEIVSNEKIDGEAIKVFATKLAREIDVNDFDNFSDSGYGRNYIGRDTSTGWEAIVMSWKEGNRTAIHGHPQYAGYTVVSGEVMLEVFEKTEGGLKKILEHKAQPYESFYAISETNDFENHIHRITGLTEKALTLHIYSHDARKGANYDNMEIVEGNL